LVFLSLVFFKSGRTITAGSDRESGFVFESPCTLLVQVLSSFSLEGVRQSLEFLRLATWPLQAAGGSLYFLRPGFSLVSTF